MRLLLFLIIWIAASSSFAYEARVLIDETSALKTFTGEMRLKCIESTGQTCSNKTYLLPAGTWKIGRSGKYLKIKSVDTEAQLKLKGYHFRLTGSLNLGEKNLQRVDLVFNKKNIDWIAYLPVDQYLHGVMTAEVPASWPLESLKAQAVASRTYFLFKKMDRLGEHFDVRSDIMDQVFHMDGIKHKSIMQAVDETHGMVLVSKKDKQIFPAYFHSDCGGDTSSENLVWRKPTSLNQSVKDPYCKTASKNNWSFFIDQDKLMALLQKAFYLPKGVQLKYILPRLHKKSRAHIVDFIFSKDIVKRISANELRKLLGFGRLKSTHFAVKQEWNEVVFTGRGFGHGVGMCQWGAQRWARKGKSFRTILKHYYPQARLKKIDPRSFKSLQAHLDY